MTPKTFLETLKSSYATPRDAVRAFDTAGAAVTLVNLSRPAAAAPFANATEQNSAFYSLQAARNAFLQAPASATWATTPDSALLLLASRTAEYRARVAAGETKQAAPRRGSAPASSSPSSQAPSSTPAPQAPAPAPAMPQEAAAGPFPLILLGIAGGLLLLFLSKKKRGAA